MMTKAEVEAGGVTPGASLASPPHGEEASPADAASAGEGAQVVALCPSCGGELLGDFCHSCGERRPESRDLTVRHFFAEAAQELTSVEHSKLFHTLFALLFRPGFLTNEWAAGRRRLYLKPLNLYLGIFALSLFAFTIYKPVSMYNLQTIMDAEQTGQFSAVINRRAARRGVPPETLLEEMSEKWQRYMSVTPLLFVLAYAVLLQVALFLFVRRYFVEHLVFSLHYVSFSLLTVVLLWPVYFFIGIKPGGVNTAVAVLKWLVDIVYMFFAVRTVYRLGTAKTAAVSVLLVVGYFACYVLVYAGSLTAAMISVILKR